MANRPVTIDVDAIVASRFPGKKFPSWVLGIIKRLIHQDFLNGYFSQGKVGTDFAPGVLEYMNVKVNVRGEENIPAEGRFTFVSNHPLGGVDAISVIAFVGNRYGDRMVIPANDFLMSLKQLDEYLVPVNNTGASGQARDLGRRLDEALHLGRLGMQVVLRTDRAFENLTYLGSEQVSWDEYHPRYVARDSDARSQWRTAVKKGGRAADDIFAIDIISRNLRHGDPILQ